MGVVCPPRIPACPLYTSLQNFISASLQQLPDPTLVLDTRGEILLANTAAARHFGTTSSQDLRALSVVQLLRDVLALGTGEPVVTEALLEKQNAIQAEAEDYQGRTLLLKCVPFQNAAAIHTGWLLTLVDLTDSRETQTQMCIRDSCRPLGHGSRLSIPYQR